MLKDLARAISKPLVIIFKNSWRIVSSQRLEERQISQQLLQVERRNLGICKQGSIALTPGKTLEQIIYNQFLILSSHIKLKRNRQLGFVKSRLHHIKLINFSDRITGFADCGEAGGVMDFDFRKAFEAVCDGILLCEGGKEESLG